jgi:hypothetical protein
MPLWTLSSVYKLLRRFHIAVIVSQSGERGTTEAVIWFMMPPFPAEISTDEPLAEAHDTTCWKGSKQMTENLQKHGIWAH